MTTPKTPARSTSAGSPAPVKRPKGEGQWALGYREPLNANEQSKKDDNPLNVRARIENIYAKGGFESIDKGDLRGRFRWWGLYTQRKPGYDGSWTGDENTDMLEDSYFMLRVRCDGGALTAAALRTLGGISTEFARDTADISDRENVQYHWIRVEDMPEIWKRLDAVGLQTTEACGDCPRVVLGSPLAGESLDEVIDGTPAIDEIVRRYIGKPEYSNLPRKFKTAVSGLQDVVHEVNDVAFIGVNHPEHGPGFDLWVGGGLSTNPMLGQRVGAWVPLDEVPEVWEAVVSVFRDYGYRRLRAKARLKYLIKDWGVEKFREVLETGVPEAHADRRARARAGGATHRPRRRATAQERAERRRRRAHRGPRLRHHPDARSPTSPRRRAPTASGSRRTRSWSSSTSPTTSSTRCVTAWTRWACRRRRRTGGAT